MDNDQQEHANAINYTNRFLSTTENSLAHFIEKPLPQSQFQSPAQAKKKGLNLLEWILISMSILVLITAIALFIVFFLIDQIPSILLNDNIDKSLLDTRKYEIIRLLNGIEVLLISDPSTSNAAVSLTLDAGIINDAHYNVPGIGHLVKAVILNGKALSELNEVINQSFGLKVYDSYRFMDLCLSYDLGIENFDQSIKLFAEMIKFHEVNESETDLQHRVNKAVRTVQEEEQKNSPQNKQETIFRKVFWSILGEKRAYTPTGSAKTFLNETFLIADLTKEVLKYYRENYIGSKMKLVLLSHLKIKELKGKVIKLFSDFPHYAPSSSSNLTQTPIKLSSIKSPIDNAPTPKGNADLGKVAIFKSFEKVTKFRVVFFVNNMAYNTAFCYMKFLKYLFDDQSQGSLNFLLKQNNYIVRHYFEGEFLKNGTVTLSFGYELTHDGLFKVNEVLNQIFNYFKLLREKKPDKELYDDLNKLFLTDFLYQETGMVHYRSFTDVLGRNMLLLSDEIKKLLMGKYYLPEFNPQFFNELFKLLIPQNSVVLLTVKKGTAEEGVLPRIKPLIIGDIDFKDDDAFPVQYSIHSFKKSVLQQFADSSTYDDALSLRKKNNYITNVRYLVKAESVEEETKCAPAKIYEENHIELWHKFDRTFGIPKRHIHLFLISPFHPSNDPKQLYLFNFHFQYLLSAFNFEFSGAIEAGSEVSLIRTENKFKLSVVSFTDLFEPLLIKALNIYYNINTSFISESLIRNQTETTANSFLKQPYISRSFDIIKAAIQNNLTAVLNPPTAYDSNDITAEINALVNQTYIRGMMYGDINRTEADRILHKHILPNVPLSSSHFSSKYFFFNEKEVITYLLEKKDFSGNTVIRLKYDPSDNSTYVANYFYMGSKRNHREDIICSLLKLITVDRFGKRLEWLRYHQSKAFVMIIDDNYYYAVVGSLPQERKADPRTMCISMDKVFLSVRDNLKKMNEDKELYRYKENVLLELNKRDQNLMQRTTKVMKEIHAARFQFDAEVRYTIDKLNKEFPLKDIVDKFDEIFLTNVKRISFQKNYTEEMDLREDKYVLNSSVTTAVTNDITHFHRR